MVAGKVKMAMGLQKSPANVKNINNNNSSPSPASNSSTKQQQSQKSSRSFGSYLSRTSAQVLPRPPDVSELLRLVEELREREKLLKETVGIVPILENQIQCKDFEIELFKKKIDWLEDENEELLKQNIEKEQRVLDLEAEIDGLKRANEVLVLSSQNVCLKSSMKPMRKCFSQMYYRDDNFGILKSGNEVKKEEAKDMIVNEIHESSKNVMGFRPRAQHVPKPPPRPSSTSSSSSSYSSNIPPPPPLPQRVSQIVAPPPPPPPPPLPAKGLKGMPAKVRRVPEVVEFYHSLMRRDTRRESGCGVVGDGTAPASAAKDMIGEIENRSAYLLAIKNDVETQGDFITFLIKEVENAVFCDIEDVIPFVRWLDDELSFLVDERAVLKHFNWPEKKADALREAAFGYCDLKKLESQASSFHDDIRQPSASALKKMQGLFEKLEHGVYNLSRMRESTANRYKGFNIPTEWMQDTGFVSQIKLASVKLAMKYIKTVYAELITVGGSGLQEDELIVQGVRFAFRVHQFAGGFDVDTMRAFQELMDKAKSCHVQWQNQLHRKT